MTIVPLWVKLLVVAALLAAAAVAFHLWEERLREQGRIEVRAEWKAANDAAEKVATAAARRAEVDSTARQLQRDKDFNGLRNRNAVQIAQLMGACVDPTILAGMRDAVRAANHEPSTGGVAASAPAAAGTPSGVEVDDWFKSVAKLYRACREQVIGWVEWDDNRTATK